MSFPLMPINGAPPYAAAALILRYSAIPTVDPKAYTYSFETSIGGGSENRWVVVMAGGASGGSIGAWSAPTCNGVTMSEIVQDGATGGSDGQRGAIWVLRVTSGGFVTIAGTARNLKAMQVYTLTGVTDVKTGYVTRTKSGDLTTAAPACALFYGVDNFGSLTSISNMEITNLNGNIWFGVNYRTTTNTTTYTINGTSMFLNRFVSWSFA